ncbi:WecB/TagA/CpsF family glycosyltransferase [Patescibacteria group bacterium]|nr:WecB/TagA/CpsF family glycosyltransferase [Patescibacteria group bacterium]
MEKVNVLGVQISAVTAPQALDKVAGLVRDRKDHYIVTPNPEFVMQALKDGNFREIINNSDLALADGIGILWAAYYLSIPISSYLPLAKLQVAVQLFLTGLSIVINPRTLTKVIPERITGADMLWEISKLASERGWSIFLLGAAPGVAYEASRKLQLLYPNLQIADVMPGPPYEFEAEVIDRIKLVNPKFVFLAFPAKEQLRWIKDYVGKLNGVTMMGIGGAFDFIAEATPINSPVKDSKAKRAPRWLQVRGLEWLWRYLIQPWRRERIKTATIDFMKTVKAYKLAQGRQN